MKKIRRHYKTIREAERYQNRLYGRYDHVRLVSFPKMSEDGWYVWEVK